jgi:hypothetical protein
MNDCRQIFHFPFLIFHLPLVDSSFKCNSAIRPKRQRRRVKLPESEPEAVATGQGVNVPVENFNR